MSWRFFLRHLHWLWIPLKGFFDLGWGLHSPKGAWVGSPLPNDLEVQFKHLAIDMSPFTFYLACSYTCNLFLSLAMGFIPFLFVPRAFLVIIWTCLLNTLILGVSSGVGDHHPPCTPPTSSSLGISWGVPMLEHQASCLRLEASHKSNIF